MQMGVMMAQCVKIRVLSHISLYSLHFSRADKIFFLCIYLTSALDAFKTSPWVFIKLLLRVEQHKILQNQFPRPPFPW